MHGGQSVSWSGGESIHRTHFSSGVGRQVAERKKERLVRDIKNLKRKVDGKENV